MMYLRGGRLGGEEQVEGADDEKQDPQRAVGSDGTRERKAEGSGEVAPLLAEEQTGKGKAGEEALGVSVMAMAEAGWKHRRNEREA